MLINKILKAKQNFYIFKDFFNNYKLNSYC